MASAKKCSKHQVGIVWNQSGPAGNPGPAGQTGALGPQGSQGLQGPQGTRGRAHAYSALATGVSVPAYPGVTAATLSLPAGSFSLAAKLYLRAENVGSYTWLANCTLAAGSDSDFAQAETEPTGGYDANSPMSLALLHTFASPGSVTVSRYGRVRASPWTMSWSPRLKLEASTRKARTAGEGSGGEAWTAGVAR
jgi:hypothetical protein